MKCKHNWKMIYLGQTTYIGDPDPAHGALNQYLEMTFKPEPITKTYCTKCGVFPKVNRE